MLISELGYFVFMLYSLTGRISSQRLQATCLFQTSHRKVGNIHRYLLQLLLK